MPKIPTYDLITFGRRLLELNDLDPIYVMLWEARLDPDELNAWLLAYWCFYNSGTASWITDGWASTYWEKFSEAAASKEFPRCRERRHFRGANAMKSVAYLVNKGFHELWAPLIGRRFSTSFEVTKYVQTWVGFGPWIAFKVADMVERLDICSVEFDAKNLYDSPREGAEDHWRWEHKGYEAGLMPVSVVPWAVKSVLERLGPMKAPPRYERTINVQEAETMLCKWHGYLKGKYHLGEDVRSLRKSLEFRPGPTSIRLEEACRRAKLW